MQQIRRNYLIDAKDHLKSYKEFVEKLEIILQDQVKFYFGTNKAIESIGNLITDINEMILLEKKIFDFNEIDFKNLGSILMCFRVKKIDTNCTCILVIFENNILSLAEQKKSYNLFDVCFFKPNSLF